MRHPAFAPEIRGTFYRAVDPQFREHAIAGSRTAGRYSRPDQPTLYLSSTVEGVNAAMVAHRDARPPSLEILRIDVTATGIVDLRGASALTALGIDMADTIAPWQDIVAAGGTPSSWVVRDRLVDVGAHGLIDPSRQRPGLWHLVLFRWNVADAPTVRIAGPPS